MNIKKIISIILCVLTLSSASIFPAHAAKSADPNNSQIVSKVKLFNDSKLEKLDYYIWQINIRDYIVEDLMDLYERLDNLVVSNINIANDLIAPNNIYDFYSTSSHLEMLFLFLNIINVNKNAQDTFWAKKFAKLKINILNSRLDQIEALNK